MSGFHLTSRDVEAIVTVHCCGFVLRDHLWQLCFPGCALRRCQRRIERLTAQKLLIAHTLPLGAFPLGIGAEFLPHVGQYAYRLGPGGVPIVAQATGTDPAIVRRRMKSSPTHLGHSVAVTSLFVAFKQFQEVQGYVLQAFQTELDARHRYEWRKGAGAPWQSAEIRPDALVWIEREGVRRPLLIEADLSTQSKAAFADKLSGYALYCRAAVFANRFGSAPFTLLIITTSDARKDTLASLVAESELALLPGVLLTTFSEFLSHGPFGPIWHCPALGAERNRFDVLSHL